MAIKILPVRSTCEHLGFHKTKAYGDVLKGLLTPPVALGPIRESDGRPTKVGWPEHEIDAINMARIAGKSEDEIRELVKRLVAQRGGPKLADQPARTSAKSREGRESTARQRRHQRAAATA